MPQLHKRSVSQLVDPNMWKGGLHRGDGASGGGSTPFVRSTEAWGAHPEGRALLQA